jgi:glycosyltransferase involved in cell wall biosynthesis
MNGDSETLNQIRNDINKANLEDVVRFIPSDNDMDSFYKEIDVFLLVSREDPYPLVVLEAASYNRPIICFDNAGGAPEFVQDDAGTVVEFLDIIGLANAVDTYQKNPDLVKQQGNIAKERVQKKHKDKNLVLAQLNQILND